MTSVLSIHWPTLLLWAAGVCLVFGILLAFIFPERSSFSGWIGETPGCGGVLVFLVGVVLALLVAGMWLAGAYANGGS